MLILWLFFDEYGQHDVKNWMKEFEKNCYLKEQTFFVLICAHANRTRTIGNFLMNKVIKTVLIYLEEWLYGNKN